MIMLTVKCCKRQVEEWPESRGTWWGLPRVDGEILGSFWGGEMNDLAKMRLIARKLGRPPGHGGDCLVGLARTWRDDWV